MILKNGMLCHHSSAGAILEQNHCVHKHPLYENEIEIYII